jgi:hypothetical protein
MAQTKEQLRETTDALEEREQALEQKDVQLLELQNELELAAAAAASATAAMAANEAADWEARVVALEQQLREEQSLSDTRVQELETLWCEFGLLNAGCCPQHPQSTTSSLRVLCFAYGMLGSEASTLQVHHTAARDGGAGASGTATCSAQLLHTPCSRS